MLSLSCVLVLCAHSVAGILRPGGAAQPVPDHIRKPQVGPEGGVRTNHCERQHRLDHRHVRARHRVRTH